MTGGSNMERNSLIYKIEDFYQTFETNNDYSRQRVAYVLYNIILFVLFLISLKFSYEPIKNFGIINYEFGCALFFEFYLLFMIEKYQKYKEQQKLKKLKKKFKGDMSEISDYKRVWFIQNFSADLHHPIDVIKNLQYLIDINNYHQADKIGFWKPFLNFINVSDAKNRILTLLVLLLSISALFLNQILISAFPPDFNEVYNSILSINFFKKYFTITLLISMILILILSLKPMIKSFIEWLTDLIWSFGNNNKMRDLSNYKAKFLIKYLIQIS